MKAFFSFAFLTFALLQSATTHRFDFCIDLHGERAERIVAEKHMHAKFYDFRYGNPNDPSTIQLLESMSFDEDTDIVLIKQATPETKDLIKRTHEHKMPYIYDEFTCGDAMIFSNVKIMHGDVTHIAKKIPLNEPYVTQGSKYYDTNRSAAYSSNYSFSSQSKNIFILKQTKCNSLCHSNNSSDHKDKTDPTNSSLSHGHIGFETRINDRGDTSIRGDFEYSFENDTSKTSFSIEGSYTQKSNGEREADITAGCSYDW